MDEARGQSPRACFFPSVNTENDYKPFYLLRFGFVMAIGILRRGHCFAFAYVNSVDYVALSVDHFISSAFGAGIAAI